MVTQKELALRLGISRSTVSRALKNSSRISRERREYIQKMAAELGYREDPALSALNAYRNNGRRRSAGVQVIGLVTSRGQRPYSHDYKRKIFSEIQNMAGTLNCRIDEFPFFEYENETRLYQVLDHRGVSGVIFTEVRNPIRYPDETFRARIPCVAIDEDPSVCPLDIVTVDYFSGGKLLLEELARRGYRRVGFVGIELFRFCDQQIDAAARFYKRLLGGKSEQIPVLYLSVSYEDSEVAGGIGLFQQWMEAYRPDAVVSSLPFPYALLRQIGCRMPEDVGYASFRNVGRDHDPRIFCLADAKVASFRVALETLQRRIHSTHLHQPQIRLSMSVEPELAGGSTLRQARQESAVPEAYSLPDDTWRDRQGQPLQGKYFWEAGASNKGG